MDTKEVWIKGNNHDLGNRESLQWRFKNRKNNFKNYMFVYMHLCLNKQVKCCSQWQPVHGHRYNGDISQKVALNCWDPVVSRWTSIKHTSKELYNRIQKKKKFEKYKNRQNSDRIKCKVFSSEVSYISSFHF